MLLPKFIKRFAKEQDVRVKKCACLYAEFKNLDVYLFVGERHGMYYLYRVFGNSDCSFRCLSPCYSDILRCFNKELTSVICAEFIDL